jgi:hypothetical protein
MAKFFRFKKRFCFVGQSLHTGILVETFIPTFPTTVSPEIIWFNKSDHLGVSIVKKSKELGNSPQTTKKRFYKNLCNLTFLNEIKEAQFKIPFKTGDIDGNRNVYRDF